MITSQQIADATGIPIARANAWFIPINNALHKYAIASPKAMAMFLANICVESNFLTELSENLNYSAKGLLGTFPTHFTVEDAQDYAHQPEKIANHVYANRHGNGTEGSGDGFKYRGRGLIQTTFKDNYRACGQALGLDLVGCPDLLTHPDNAALSAGWYWDTHGCNALAEAGDLKGVRIRINGGLNGFDDVQRIYTHALPILQGVHP